MGHLVFDGDHIRAEMTLANGDTCSDKLAVVFDFYSPGRRGFGHLGPLRTALARGYDCLTVMPAANDWYVNDETASFEGVLWGLTHGLRDVRGFGMSMGGFGALRFARAMRASYVSVLSPQVSMAPDVAAFETRYTVDGDGFDPALGDLRRHKVEDLRGAIYVDPFDRADMAHARLLSAIAPNLSLCRLAGGGHPAHKGLRQAGHKRAINDMAFTDVPDPGAIARLHNRAKAGTQIYWKGLRARAEGERAALAAYASAQLAAARQAA
ncbi:MAG: alpha/beta hydrolase [Pseudomonadota bacterium]